jgi:hypothetical protein
MKHDLELFPFISETKKMITPIIEKRLAEKISQNRCLNNIQKISVIKLNSSTFV